MKLIGALLVLAIIAGMYLKRKKLKASSQYNRRHGKACSDSELFEQMIIHSISAPTLKVNVRQSTSLYSLT